MESRTAYRKMLSAQGITIQPAVYDPLSARLAQAAGCRAVGLGGYAMGAHLVSGEPLLSLDVCARITRDVTFAVDLPVMIDAGAGWGEPLHVAHTTRVLERAGAASMHLEDQAYPKRAHYHRGIEHVVSIPEMVDKIKAAVRAREDPDFVICARTDAMRTHGYAEGIRRAAAYMEAGADAVMLFPNNDDETQQTPRDLPGVPLAYVNSTGNKFGRGVYPAKSLEEWGWRILSDAISSVNVVSDALRRLYVNLATTGETGLDPENIVIVREQLERDMGLDAKYELEAATVERIATA
jgi:2-methylisocitrate lyase-like PEP mutase family enzyme